jgi:hypothetical protein
MPSPKSGKAGSAVTPAEPKKSEEADRADPGKVEEIKAEQRKTKAGKYGTAKTTPYKPPEDEAAEENKKSWIEIEMIDEAGKPVAGLGYRITLSDGATIAEGTLDEKGFARLEGIEPGDCKITFPTLDEEAWEKA